MLSVSITQAQVVKEKTEEAKSKTGQKAEGRVDRKIDQGIDKGLDAFEGLFKKKKKRNAAEDEADEAQNTSANASLANLFGGGSNAIDLPASYNFSKQMDVQLTSTNKRGKQEEMTLKYHLSPENKQLGLSTKDEKNRGEEAFTVFDMAEEYMVVFSSSGSEKVAMAIPIKQNMLDAYSAEDEKAAHPDFKYTKTGRTKTILGYTCHEYKFTSEEQNGSSWITNDLPDFSQNFMLLSDPKGKNKNNLPSGFPQGTLLEMHMTDQKGEKMDWLVTKIDKNASHTITTSDYQLMQMPAMGGN